jgi:hypothetical protein
MARPMACIYQGALVATPVVAWSTTAAEAATWHDGGERTSLEQSAEVMALVNSLFPDQGITELDETDRQAARGVEVVEWFADLFEAPPSNRPPPLVSDVVPALARSESDEADTEPMMSEALIREVRARGLI